MTDDSSKAKASVGPTLWGKFKNLKSDDDHLLIYLGLGLVVIFLFAFSLGPEGGKFGVLSVLKQLQNIFAAGTAAVEPETGQISGAATIGGDTNASGGRYAQFGGANAESELVPMVSDVTTSTSYKYGVKDSAGSSMDTVKIIENTQTAGDPNRYLAVYHTLSGTVFNLKLATSSDLVAWSYKKDLDTNAHQPTIAKLTDGSFAVAYEIGPTTACTGTGGSGNNCLKFRHFANLTALLAGTFDKEYVAARSLSNCAEGTPNIQSVSLNPDINNSQIDVRFHYFRDCNVDRQANGILTNFNSWSAQANTNLNSLFEGLSNPSIGGNVGDRDHLVYKGADFNLHEAQLTKGDFCSWRPYLYNYTSNKLVALSLKTHAGRVAFANPSFTNLTLPNGKTGVVSSYFVPGSNSAGPCPGSDPAGELMFYKEYSQTASAGRVAGATSASFTFTAGGDFGTGTEADATFKEVKNQGADFFLTLGDMRYGTLTDTGFCDFVKQRVEVNPAAPVYPIEMLAGNHDYNSGDGNIDNMRQCLPDRLGNIVGDYAKRYYFDYPQSSPVARFVLIIPGLGGSYSQGGADYNWVQATIDDARAKNIPWVIAGYHKTCITMYATRGCESGQDIMNLLHSKKVDLILNGHDHHYQRGKQLALGATCLNIPYNSSSGSGCIVDSDSPYTKGVGTVTVTQGMGGHGLYSLSTSDGDAKYFAQWNNTAYGIMKYTVTAGQITAEFKRSYGGAYSDTFVIGNPDAVAPSAPFNLTGTSPSGNEIDLSWQASTDNAGGSGLSGYQVWRASAGQPASQIATTANTSYADKTVSPAMGYSYFVKAVDNAGNVSAASNTVNVTSQCTIFEGPYGMVATSVNLSETSTYKVWSRIMPPDATNNIYWLQIDNLCTAKVGGPDGLTAGAWTWVDYKDGNTSNKVTFSLTQGAHNIKLISLEPGLKLDRVIFTSDTNCVPTGTGDNCTGQLPSPSPTPILSPTPSPSPSSIPSPSPSPGTDSDGDGFSDSLENYIGTDPNDKCADVGQNYNGLFPGDDAWPPDINNNAIVNIVDLVQYRNLPFAANNAQKKRLDLNGDGNVDQADVDWYKGKIPAVCS